MTTDNEQRTTNNDSAAISARFSAAAGTYDDYADVQREAAKGVVDLARLLDPPDRILDVGCGTGVLTAMIADAFPRARIEAVDIAPGLVATARFHFAANDRIRCLVADARRFCSSVRFQLIVSNASLHWMEPLSDTFKNLAGIVTADGHLAFSIMLSGTLAELREARLRIAPHKPPRTRLPTEETVLQALDTAGLVVLEKKVLSLKAEYPSARDLFDGIHHLGVTGGPLSQSTPQAALLTRKELARLLTDYAEHYSRGDGGVWASFEVMYVLASRRVER